MTGVTNFKPKLENRSISGHPQEIRLSDMISDLLQVIPMVAEEQWKKKKKGKSPKSPQTLRPVQLDPHPIFHHN